jgi:RNA polymerase sigma-54 factor
MMQPTPVHRLEARCSPLQIAFAQFLALDASGFDAAIDAEVEANPALERSDPVCCGGGGPCCRPSSVRATETDVHGDPMDGLSARSTWRQALIAELTLEVPEADTWLAAQLVDSLDDRGLLDAELPQVAERLGAPLPALQRVLVALRSLTCAGAGATTLQHHLLLELERVGDQPGADLAQALVRDHLHLLARGEARIAARGLGADPAAVDAACRLISDQHPYPLVDAGRGMPAPRTSGIPDIAVHRPPGTRELEVRVLEAERMQVRVSPSYLRALQQPADPAARDGHAEVVAAVRAAQGFLGRVAQRWRTMAAVGDAVAEHQRDFLLDERPRPRPLTRAAVAKKIGVHESTVGRAVKGRRALMPSGRIVPLAELFPVSQEARELLRTILAEEPRPLTDAELAHELNRRGHAVARRTVAKYRSELGVASVAGRG